MSDAEKNSKSVTNEELQPKLVFYEGHGMTESEMSMCEEMNNEVGPMRANNIDVHGMKVTEKDHGWEVKGIIRHTLANRISFEEIDVLMIDEDESVAARSFINLSSVGLIERNTAVPMTMTFPKETLNQDKPPSSGWKLRVNLANNSTHTLEFEPLWDERLTDVEKQEWTRVVKTLPGLKENEVNFHFIRAEAQGEDRIALTMLIRNGRENLVQFKKLALSLKDHQGELIAKAHFDASFMKVKSNTSKPWTFVFEPNDIQQLHPSFENVKVEVSNP